eukprot:CAMPEP_0178498810 /NCGR_PEP_ID=MMETSP0696-20121128/15467_1 /TAXON_ID=265572 /ORGANISM="Extubocellulus spinifer, Strain CCMP396" /LENGTH=74 /DNA_ID=CAMNT_0020127421 /DNA_START=2156 /DNA_END=2381 /DNA_ORIENTATION=+
MSGRGDDLDWVSACLITANSSHSAYPPQVNGPGAQGTGIDVSVDAGRGARKGRADGRLLRTAPTASSRTTRASE